MQVADFGFNLEHTFTQTLPDLAVPTQAASVPQPHVQLFNHELAAQLGLKAAAFQSEQGATVLTGNVETLGLHTQAQAYTGYQFGQLAPLLGDGRALLLGEQIAPDQQRVDIHYKGSGPTPFSRRGDGKAAYAPMLREYLISEAMQALGIPTTRALAVTTTGERVQRSGPKQAAVLTRTAASHIRVGTFQYAAMHADTATLKTLADYTIKRHYPALINAEEPYLALLQSMLERQANLVAQWMGVGFVHGVMNTDNMTLSGESIDYGPCAFIDAYHPNKVFSSIDHGGRYAFGNQAPVAQWNLARFAETLLPLLGDDTDAAVEQATKVINRFNRVYQQAWLSVMRPKLGLHNAASEDEQLINDWLQLLQAQAVDYTLAFRHLAAANLGDTEPLLALFPQTDAAQAWLERWQTRLNTETLTASERSTAMNTVNPLYIPRNHRVEEALAAAEDGDLKPFEYLLSLLQQPFTEQAHASAYTQPAPAAREPYVTYCGT